MTRCRRRCVSAIRGQGSGFLLLMGVAFLSLRPLPAAAYVILTERVGGKIGAYYWSVEEMPISLVVDGGESGLGDIEVLPFVEEELRKWEEAPYAFVRFAVEGMTQEDIDVETLEDESSPFLLIGDHRQEIIFDPDGEILSWLGLDPGSILGLGYPVVEGADPEVPGPFTGEIIDGFVLINTSGEQDPESVKATLIHEVGHFLGLGHTPFWLSLVGDDENGDGHVSLNEIDFSRVPTMFPFALPDDALANTLEPDDIAAISALYPEPDFETAYGAIAGTVTRPNGAGFFGASIFAIRLGRGNNLEEAVGGLSGYKTGRGGDGEFQITGLVPGDYILILYPVDPDLIGIGPENIGLMFQNIETDCACEFLRDVDCFTGEGGEFMVVTVTAGKTTEVHFTVNGEDGDPAVTRQEGAFPDLPYVGGEPRGGFPSERSDTEQEDGGGCGCHATRGGKGEALSFFLLLAFFVYYRRGR